MFGRRYVIEHCVSRLKKISEEEAYKVYITDALKAVSENTGRLVKEGVAMKSRFIDLIADNKSAEDPDIDDNEKAREIISNMRKKLKKLGGKEES